MTTYGNKQVINPALSYHLVLVLFDNEFSFSLFDYGRKLVRSSSKKFFRKSSGLRSWLTSEGLLLENIRKVTIGVSNTKVSCKPSEIILDSVHVNSDKSGKVNNFYSTDRDEFIGLISSNFDQVVVHHITSAFLQYGAKNIRNGLLLNRTNSVVEILAFKTGKLLLCKQFQAKSDLELLYQVMRSYTFLGLKPESIPLYLGGDISESDGSYNYLKQYIKSIQFVDTAIRFSDPSSTLNPDKHLFFDHFALLKCA